MLISNRGHKPSPFLEECDLKIVCCLSEITAQNRIEERSQNQLSGHKKGKKQTPKELESHKKFNQELPKRLENQITSPPKYPTLYVSNEKPGGIVLAKFDASGSQSEINNHALQEIINKSNNAQSKTPQSTNPLHRVLASILPFLSQHQHHKNHYDKAS